MKVYIAGPMRGIPEWNFPAFHEARKRWREAGHTAFSPASTDEALGYSETTEGFNEKPHLLHVIHSDILCISNADAIALLPGWEKSSGATVELALAQFLGLKVFDAVTMKQKAPSKTPWGVLGGLDSEYLD